MAQRISIGIQFGPPLALRVSDEQLGDLQKALESGAGWHEVDAEDGAVRIRLDSVLWLRVDKDEHRVGFGLAS